MSNSTEHKIVESKERSIADILANCNELVFPAYQRPYEWTNAINRQFFLDLTNESAFYSIGREGEDRYYFLGPLYRRGNDILDGQQRLTSLAIWNNAEIHARDIFSEWVTSCQEYLSAFESGISKIEEHIQVRNDQLETIKQFLSEAWTLNNDQRFGLKKSLFGRRMHDGKDDWTKSSPEKFLKLALAIASNEKFNDIDKESFNSLKTIVKDYESGENGISKPLADVGALIKKLGGDLKILQLPEIEVSDGATKLEKNILWSKAIINKISLSSVNEVDLSRVKLKSDNHVEHKKYDEIERFCSCLFTGKFEFGKTQKSGLRELRLEVAHRPQFLDRNAEIAEFQIAKDWESFAKKPEDKSGFYSIKAVLDGVAANQRIAPYEQKYLCAYVFYLYHSLATAITQYFDKSLSTQTKNIMVNGVEASKVFLSDVGQQVLVAEMNLHRNIQPWDAQTLFHTINARGLSLSDSDKVRNLLICSSAANSDEKVSRAFSKLVQLFLTAGDRGIKLGFEENDIFYWANQYINTKSQTTQKSFVSNVEAAIRKENSRKGDGVYARQFIDYLLAFCDFFERIASHGGEVDHSTWVEYRLILKLDFPKASYPLLFAIHQRFHASLSVNHKPEYEAVLRGVGLYFFKRRCDVFGNKKVDTIQKLLSRTHAAIADVLEQSKDIEGLRCWVKKWFPVQAKKDKQHFLLISHNPSQFFNGVAVKVKTNISKPKFYGGNRSHVTRFILLNDAIKTGQSRNIEWNSDLEHLVLSQSKGHKMTDRLGNIFLLQPEYNRSIGDACPEEKFRFLHEKTLDSPEIQQNDAYIFLKDNYSEGPKAEQDISADDCFKFNDEYFEIIHPSEEDMLQKFIGREEKLLASLEARVNQSYLSLKNLQ